MRQVHAVLLLLMAIMVSACSTTSSDRFEKAGASREDALESYTSLGLQYLRAGDTAGAKSPLQRALDIDDSYAPAYNAMALVFQAERDLDIAESYFRKAIDADPESAMIHNNFGVFLFSQERYQEACTQLARATEDPFYSARAQAFENLGRCYRRTGRPDVAEHALRRALTLSQQRPLALVELSDLMLEKNQETEAAALFNRFRELVDSKRVNHFPLSLWVGIRVARYEGNANMAATYALLLKNMYPRSSEYRAYKESAQ
ncbi:type IV pilus biogenesis/stability protein PilW [Marinobacterium mangrovicola]|uniref:Type IV pilus assembly protein PilF n=1 Tax=Marinobacterium mangrovicola TaxID=1476959 RepID=A0A4R1GIB0_9GAMM|nr:type IV pilus biogenesis/stability protein PilW [Marinobacterium mangrovicola]TCK05589.1 type IV pilus assembly protein PilF [Marinobacterium mangrovicola]